MPVPALMPEWLRRAATNPIIYAAKRAGHTVSDIKETVDSFMGKTRWLQYGRDISKMVSIASKENALLNFSPTKPFTQNVITETFLKGNRNYMIVGNALIHDTETGDTFYSPFSMYTDYNKSIEDHEQMFRDRFLQESKYKNTHLISLEVSAVLHDARRPR